MNRTLLLLSSYLALTSLGPELQSNSGIQDWNRFKLEHGKKYEDTNVEVMRRIIFANNMKKIAEFNEQQSDDAGFGLGINHLADMSDLEVKVIMNGFKLPKNRNHLLKNDASGQKFLNDILADDSIEVPDAVDWRTVPGRVSRVKNQGSCGSCWAFASTGALEGQEKKTNSSLRSLLANDDSIVELSEQNLVDCVKQDYGCKGGLMEDAFNFIRDEQGIDDEKSYPYEAVTKKCRFQKNKVAMTDKGAAILPEGDEEKLKEIVAKFGPVAVAIDASSFWFQFYKHGVYYNKHCKNKKDELDHGVLVVGYGTDPKKGDYWIVKNSWGPHFGENGYIRMARNRNNNCGIATVATIPTF